MTRLRDMLADGKVHVMDGAMGTMLYARGVFVNVCYDELNATRPELVAGIHEQYVRAGAEVIETNTFGANPVKLSAHGLDERTEELNRRAAEVARSAAAGRAAVAGAIGPLGVRVEPLGPTSLDEARAYFARQAAGLLEGGVDGFVLETFSDLGELEQAAKAVAGLCSLPAIAQITVGEDGKTADGATVEQAARAAEEWGVAAVGLNCSVGPATILDGLERMAAVTGLPLSAQPNAGLPRTVGDRKIYMAGPEYMALYAKRVIAVGARFVGGCCGTTPEHVRRMREEVARVQPRTPVVRTTRPPPSGTTPARRVPLGERSALGRRLADDGFVRSVRVSPPSGWDASQILRDCRLLAESGIPFVEVGEDRQAPRMSAWATAALLARDGAVEPVVRCTCRGRRLNEIIGDLLGLAASGVRNVLVVTGDAPGPGPYPEFDSVVDVDSIGLANVIAGLNAGAGPAGNSIGAPAAFVVGAALNQGSRDPKREIGRLRWKEEAGVDFVATRPVFDADHLLAFLAQAAPSVPVLAVVRPLESARQAEFLKNEVPGVHLPGRVVERMRKAEQAGGPGGAKREGLALAVEAAQGLADHVSGLLAAPGSGGPSVARRILQGHATPPRNVPQSS